MVFFLIVCGWYTFNSCGQTLCTFICHFLISLDPSSMIDKLITEGILVISDIDSLAFVRWHVWWHHIDSGLTILYLVIQADKGLVFNSTGFYLVFHTYFSVLLYLYLAVFSLFSILFILKFFIYIFCLFFVFLFLFFFGGGYHYFLCSYITLGLILWMYINHWL